MNGTLERNRNTAGSCSVGPYSVGIVSPETLLRASLQALLKQHSTWNVTAEASTIHDGIAIAATNSCDVIIVNYELPFGNAADFLLELSHLHLRASVLVLHREWNDKVVAQLRALGAKGMLSTTATPAELVDALTALARHEQYWSPKQHLPTGQHSDSSPLRAKIRVSPTDIVTFNSGDSGDFAESNDPLTPLSNREREIFLLLASGMTNVGIAKKLFLSPRTVETHRARIVRKLGFNSNGQLIRFALRHGLAPL